MLKSSELLKRKICVTVFLDELFEELEEEANETSAQESRGVKSGVKIAEEPPNEQVNMFVCENETKDCGGNEVEAAKPRPRKCRQQSKFGKPSNSFRRELNCCGASQIREGDIQKSDAKTKPPKQAPQGKSSVSKLVSSANKSSMTEERFLSRNSTAAQKIDRGVDCVLKVLSHTKSTQFDSAEVKKTPALFEDKEQQTEEKSPVDVEPLVKEDGQKSEADGADEVNQPEPNSGKSCSTSQIFEKIIKEDALFVSSSSEQISNVTPEEVIRVWSTCKKVWNESVESDMSEAECNAEGNKAAKHYSAVLDSNRNSIIELEKTKTYTTQFFPCAGSDTKFLRSTRKTVECKQETKSAIIETSRAEEPHALEQTKFRVLMEPANIQFECRSKNFAEGDIFEDLGSNVIFRNGSKENPTACDKVVSGETNEVIVSKAKVQFINSKTLETISQHFAEVFMKQESGSLDAESEMIFAESPNEAEGSPELQVFEFEGMVPRTKFLKRMSTTLEIFGSPSVNDMEDVSNELILICEDLEKENVYLDGWKRNSKSLYEMKELYLKDSKESTMYLIEIPFIKSAGKGFRDF